MRRGSFVQDRDDIVAMLRKHFARSGDAPIAVYLFGSVARGAAGASSDVDVAVLFAVRPEPTLEGLGLGMQDELEGVLGCPVDVVVLNGAPVDLVHRVLRDGVLVLDRDPGARVRFEVRARNEYFDIEPVLRRYRHPEETGHAEDTGP